MELLCYPKMCRESKLCMTRERWRYGKKYYYRPRSHLLNRLAKELNMTKEQVRDQIAKEKAYLLKNPHLATL